MHFNPTYYVAWSLVFIIVTVPRVSLGLDLVGGWELDPTFSLATEYADNPLLILDAKEAGLVTTPVTGLLLRRHEERWQANLAAQMDYTIFSGLDIPDIDNQRFELRSAFRVTERNSFTFSASYLRDNLVRRILLFDEDFIADPQDIEDIDIGLLDFTLRRNRIRLAPSWTHELTERTAIGITYTFIDVSFEDLPAELAVAPFGTEANRVELSALYRPMPDVLLSMDVDVLRVTSEDIQTDTLAFLVGLEYPFSERLRVNPRVGYRISSTEVNEASRGDTKGFVGQLAAEYQSELSQFQGVITRMVNPAGRGQANQTDRIVFQYFRSILPRLSFSLGVDGFITEPVGVDIEERGWLEARSGLSWNWTQWWAIEAGYTYRRRSVGDFSNHSNGIYAAITYTPPRPGR